MAGFANIIVPGALLMNVNCQASHFPCPRTSTHTTRQFASTHTNEISIGKVIRLHTIAKWLKFTTAPLALNSRLLQYARTPGPNEKSHSTKLNSYTNPTEISESHITSSHTGIPCLLPYECRHSHAHTDRALTHSHMHYITYSVAMKQSC